MSLIQFKGMRWLGGLLAILFLWTESGMAQYAASPFMVSSPQAHIDIVQDLHCNFQTQESIFNYLSSLKQQGKLTEIFQEGACGPVDLSMWSRLDSATKEKLTQGLMREGWMGGAERFAVLHPEVRFTGAEGPYLYEFHRDVYEAVSESRERALESLKNLKQVLTRLKHSFYSKPLEELERDWEAARSGQGLALFLKKYQLESLVDTHKDKNAAHFDASLRKAYESLISKRAKTKEEHKLIHLFHFFRGLEKLWALEMTPDDFKRFTAAKNGAYLKKDLMYLLCVIPAKAGIFPPKADPPSAEKPQKQDSCFRRNDTKRYASRSLPRATTRGWHDTQREINFFALDHMGTPENFYRFAIERDERMFETVREALKKHPGYAVLVVGGFHGESLARKFAQGGLPYSLVSPAFREIDTDLNEKYMRAMGRLPEGEKLNRWVHSLLEKLSPSIYSVRPEAGEVIASLSRRFTRGNTIRPGKNIFRSRPLRRPRLLSRALGAFVLGLSFAVFSPARAQDLNVPEWLSFRELTPKIEKVLKSFEQAENPKERARLAKALAEIVARANNAKVKKIIIDDLGERVEKNADRKIESIKSSNFYWDLIPALIASVFVALGAWGWTRFFVRERTIQESIEFDNSPFVVQPGEVLQLFTEKGVEILIDGDEVIVGNTTYTLEKGVNIFDREGVSERNSEYTGEVTVFEVQEDTTDAERLFIIDNDRGKIEVQVSSVAKSWQAALGRSENSGSLFPSTSFMTAVIFIIALVGLPMMKYALPRKPTHPFSTADLLAVIRQVDVSEELLPESELESESESTPEPAIQSPAAESETPQEAAAPAPPADFLPPQTEPEHPVLEELPEPEPTIPIIPLPFAAEARVSKNVQPIIAENSGILRLLDGGEFAILPEDLIDQERDILAQIEEQKKRIDEAIKSWETDRKFADADLRVREKSNLQEVLERELAKLEEEAAKISARVADFAVTPGDPPGHSYEVTFSAADEAYITSGQTIGACDADWTRILKTEIPNALAFRILNGAKLTCHVTGTLGGSIVYGVVVEDAQAAGETKILALTVSSAAVRQESGAISLTLSIEGGEGLSPEEAVSSDQHFLIAGKISPRPVQEIHVNKSGNIIFYERITQGTLLEPGDHVIGEYDGAYVGDAYYSGAKIGRKIEEAESEIAHLGEVSDQIRGLTREISRLESVPKGAGQTIEQEDLGEISALLDQINGIVLTAPQKSGDALRAAINRLKALAVSLKTVKLHPKGYVARQAKLIAQVIEDQTAAGQVIDFEALSAQVTALVDIDFSRLKDADEIEVALASVETDKKALIRKALEALGATPDQDFARLSQARIEQLNEFLAALREAAGAVPVGITISGEQAVRILELNKEAGEGAPILVHSNGSYFETAVNRQKAAELGLEDGMRVILRTPAGDLEGVLRLEEREGAELAVYVLFPELAGVGGDVPALLGIEAQSLGSLVSSRLRGLPAWKLSLAFAAAALLGACTFPFITKSDLDTVRTEERLDIDNSPITPKKEVSLEKLEVTSDEEGKIFVTEVKESGEKVTRPLEEYVAERNDGIISAKLTLDSAEATEAFFDSIQIVPVLGGNYSFESHKHFGGQFGFLITLGRYGSLTLAGGANSLEGDFQRSLSFIGSIQSLFTQIGPYEDELRHIAARNAGYRHQELIGDEVTQARNILRTSWEWKQQTVYLEAIKTHLETAIRYATEKAALEISGRYWQDQVNFLKEKLGVTESALTEIHHAYGKLALEKEKFGDLLGLHDDIPIDVGDKTGSLDLNRVDTLSIKADNRRGLGETEILQATAGTSSRVGRALDAWTTIACELIIQDRDFLGVYPYIFEGIHIDDSDLTLAIDPNRINWLRRAIRETGLVVKGPDLIQIGKRMFGGAKDEALQPLRDERAAIIRAVQTTEVNKIRRARFNYFAGLNALVDARDGISQAEQSLQEAQGRLTDGHQDAAYDIFLSKVKVEEAQIQFVAARAQYERALDEFQAFLEDLRANLVRAGPVLDGMGDEEQVEVEQEVINGLGQPYIDALEEAAPIPNQWVVGEDVDITNLQRVSAPAAHEGIGARSLGVEASIQQQANNALSELGLSATDARTGLLIPYLGFLTVALASLSPTQKAQFISKLLSKLGDLASSDIPAGNQESPAVVFADEEYFAKAGPEFIQSFVSKRLRLDVFVSARTPEIAAEKIRQFFPAQVPANVHAHAYNSGLPLVQAMNAVLATPELAGTDPVILSNQSALVRKVSSPLHRVIRVIHDANYPAELALELGRKISATGGQGQVMGTERVGKDDFRLLSIPELIDDLFADITGARLREQSA